MKFVLYQNRFIHLCLCDKISTTAEYYYTSQQGIGNLRGAKHRFIIFRQIPCSEPIHTVLAKIYRIQLYRVKQKEVKETYNKVFFFFDITYNKVLNKPKRWKQRKKRA